MRSINSILFILIVALFQSCNTAPKTQDIELTYLVKDNSLSYTRIDGAVLLGDNPKLRVSATVTNTSEYPGTFKLHARLSSLGKVIEFEQELYIAVGATVEFKQVKEIDPYSFESNVKVEDWGIIAPTKTIQIK